MKTVRTAMAAAALIAALVALDNRTEAATMPTLQKQHGAWQLIVDGKPFLMRGGEFSNNVYEAPKDIPCLAMMLDAYKSYDLNTLLVPISWRSLEPSEGQFDFRMIDTLIEQCRARNLRVIVLWFGAYKNGGVGYTPQWFAHDHTRFYHARRPDGKEVFAVSPFCAAAWQADLRAFRALMEHIKAKDAGKYTVLMVQPENETGCQEIDNDRDHSAPANRAWAEQVPGEVTKHLAAHDGRLVPWLQKVWDRNGKKATGTWPEVFGSDVDGQKIFMSYYIARFVERVASAGKAVYPLPMFVNDWLGSIESPGGPIGGPDYQVLDIWRVGCPSVQAFVPDIYQDNFKAWLAAYDRQDNPILVPEAQSDARAAQQCWYTYFQHKGLLYSPYLLVPHEAEQKEVPRCLRLTHLQASYGLLKEMDEILLSKQGLLPRQLLCFALDQNERPTQTHEDSIQGISVAAQATAGYATPRRGQLDVIPPFAAIVALGEREFAVIGTHLRVTFRTPGLAVQSAERGAFRANRWVAGPAFQAETAAEHVVVTLQGDADKLDVLRLKLKEVGK